jgi:hypothetical protein
MHALATFTCGVLIAMWMSVSMSVSWRRSRCHDDLRNILHFGGF